MAGRGRAWTMLENRKDSKPVSRQARQPKNARREASHLPKRSEGVHYYPGAREGRFVGQLLFFLILRA